MRAFWAFVRNFNDDGTKENRPDLPSGHNGSYIVAGEVRRITGGPTGFEHDHLLVGGFAVPDDNQILDLGHSHVVIQLDGGQWVQQSRQAITDHDHDLDVDNLDNYRPFYFLIFWWGEDVGAALVEAFSGVILAAEATITAGGEPGSIPNTTWNAAELALWQARSLNLLGFQLPSGINSGKRLVQLFVNLLGSRVAPERAFREYGED